MTPVVALIASAAVALHGGASNGKPTCYVGTNPFQPSAIACEFRNTAHMVVTPGNRHIYYVRTNATVTTWTYTKGHLRDKLTAIRASA